MKKGMLRSFEQFPTLKINFNILLIAQKIYMTSHTSHCGLKLLLQTLPKCCSFNVLQNLSSWM